MSASKLLPLIRRACSGWIGAVIALALLPACTSPAEAPASASASASASAAAATEPAAGPITLAQASLLYRRRCSVCHGERGDGQSLASTALSQLPRNFTTESSRLVLTREYMIAIVRDGRPGNPMVGRATRLSQVQIEAIVDFVRAAFIPPDPASAAGRGLGLYQARCAACHGDRGEGGAGRRGAPRAPEVSLARPGSTLTEARWLAALSADAHVAALKGRRLDETERQAVLAYVRQALIEQLGGSPAPAAADAVGH